MPPDLVVVKERRLELFLLECCLFMLLQRTTQRIYLFLLQKRYLYEAKRDKQQLIEYLSKSVVIIDF